MLTIHGGVTSHAAVVMRGMGKPAVTGACRMAVRAAPVPDQGAVTDKPGAVESGKAAAGKLEVCFVCFVYMYVEYII